MSNRIYTRTGDSGQTGLFGGERVRKDHERVEAYGTVDELNALLGVAQAQCDDAELSTVLLSFQHDLFQLGADLATPLQNGNQKGRITIRRIEEAQVQRLEGLIDRFEAELAPLTNFILPGGHPFAAALHHCRGVCRRAERRCVAMLPDTAAPDASEFNSAVIRYLNRLSDLLFVLSRVVNRRHNLDDIKWNP